MAETIRDVVIRVQMKQIETNLKVPDVGPSIKAVDKFSKAIDKFAKTAEDGFKVPVDGAKQARKAIEDSASKITDANLKVLDSTKLVGEGFFTVARGVTFLGISSEESLQKVVANVAKAQAGFDLFKGSTDVIKGVVEGTRALKVATGAATIAEAIHATAIGITSKAANVATASFVALRVAMGPIGLVITAVAAAVTAGAAAWALFGKEGEKALNTVNRKAQTASETVRTLFATFASVGKLRGIDRAAEDALLKFQAPGDRAKALQSRIDKNQSVLDVTEGRFGQFGIKDVRERFRSKDPKVRATTLKFAERVAGEAQDRLSRVTGIREDQERLIQERTDIFRSRRSELQGEQKSLLAAQSLVETETTSFQSGSKFEQLGRDRSALDAAEKAKQELIAEVGTLEQSIVVQAELGEQRRMTRESGLRLLERQVEEQRQLRRRVEQVENFVEQNN